MEGILIFIHFALAAFFGLYLLLKLLISIFAIWKPNFEKKLRQKLRWVDWTFLVLIGLSGIYLVIALRRIEFYHVLKLLSMAAIVVLPFYWKLRKLALIVVVSLLALIAAFTLGIKKQPLFFKKQLVISESLSQQGELADSSGNKLGQVVFKTICVECHGEDGKLGKFQAIDLSTSVLSLEDRVEVISNGRPVSAMRAFKHELSAEQIQAVAHYIENLRSN